MQRLGNKLMGFDHGELAELIDQVRVEGNARLQMAPIVTANASIPQPWRDLLTRDDAHLRLADELWRPAELVLPRVVTAIKQCLQGVGLLMTDSKKPSLIYIFTKQGEIFSRRGYPPTQNLPSISLQLPVDLSVIYQIHDGWIDLFSGDTGPLPTEEWQILGRSNAGEQDGFLEIFTAGGNALGFDIGESPPRTYIIWSDEDVESVDNFWSRLDSWLGDGFKKMDRNFGQ